MINAMEAKKLSLQKEAFDNANKLLPKIGEVIIATAREGKGSVEYHLGNTMWYYQARYDVTPSASAKALKERLEEHGYTVEWKTHWEERQFVDVHLIAVIRWE